MSKYATGKHSKAISDRSGMEFPYKEMVREWNGSFVHYTEYEPKQPQLEPKPIGGDGVALLQVRPARVEPPTADLLTTDPFKLLSLQSKIEVSHPNSGIQVGDQVRLTATAAIPFTNLVGTPGAMSILDIELSTTLAADITASDTTLTLTDFLAATLGGGFLVIEKVNSDTGLFQNEIIQYTSHNNLLKSYSGLTRGTNVPFRGVTPANTTASAHSAGSKVFISREVSSLNSTNGYVLNSQTTALVDSQRGGGENCTAGPLNDKG